MVRSDKSLSCLFCITVTNVNENICLICNPNAEAKGEITEASHPSVYVGETARSIAERSSQLGRAIGIREKTITSPSITSFTIRVRESRDFT